MTLKSMDQPILPLDEFCIDENGRVPGSPPATTRTPLLNTELRVIRGKIALGGIASLDVMTLARCIEQGYLPREGLDG